MIRKIVYSNKKAIGSFNADVLLHLADFKNTMFTRISLVDVPTLCGKTLVRPYWVRLSTLNIVRGNNRVKRCSICAARGSFEDVLSALEAEIESQRTENETARKESEINRMWNDLGCHIEQIVMDEWRLAADRNEILPLELSTYRVLYEANHKNLGVLCE